MSRLAKGDLSAEEPCANRRDDIREMAATVLVFRDGLAEAERLRTRTGRRPATRRGRA